MRVGGDSDTQVVTTSAEVTQLTQAECEKGREENKSKAETQGTAGFKEARGGRTGRAERLSGGSVRIGAALIRVRELLHLEHK